MNGPTHLSARPPAEPEPPLKHCGEVVRRLRLRQGLTQTELARQAQLSRNQLVAIENGSRNPSPEALGRISEALGLEPARMAELQVGIRSGVQYPREWDSLLPYLQGVIDDPHIQHWERHRLTDKIGQMLAGTRGLGRPADPERMSWDVRPRDPWRFWCDAARSTLGSSAGTERESAQSLLLTLMKATFEPADDSERRQREALLDRIQAMLLALPTQELDKVAAYVEGLLSGRHPSNSWLQRLGPPAHGAAEDDVDLTDAFRHPKPTRQVETRESVPKRRRTATS